MAESSLANPLREFRFRIGPGGVVYLIVAALILGVAIYTQANLLFWSFGLMVGGLIVSMILAWLSLRHVSVLRMLPGHGVVGEALIVRYEIRNARKWIPTFNLVIRETWDPVGWWSPEPPMFGDPLTENPPRLRGQPHGWVLHLGPAQVAQAEAPCWPLRRGLLHFHAVEISTSFPFGVIRRSMVVQQSGKVLVYPHLYRIQRRLMHSLTLTDLGGRRRVEKPGGTEEFFGLRQYRQGDTLRMIDWKRTARTGQLISREMTHPSPPKLMLGLDLTPSEESSKSGASPGSTDARAHEHLGHPANAQPQWDENYDPATERAIALAASIICDAHLHRFQIGLMVQGVPCPIFPLHHSLPHRTRMLEALALLDTTVRIPGPTGGAVRPSVVVVPTGAPRPLPTTHHPGRTVTLVAEHMEELVDEYADGSISALATRESGAVAQRDMQPEERLA